MPRFVILCHEMPGSQRGLHWDFMLEQGEMLRTWALHEEPISGAEIRAEVLADHRALYLDYEGPISGERGTVSRWDRGQYEVRRSTPESVVVELRGDRLIGTATLRAEIAGSHRWIFEFSTCAAAEG
ncbi:MAG TPA: DNA polymerase ligase N-terminal domain-containing protein [Pirellulales bacterium]